MTPPEPQTPQEHVNRILNRRWPDALIGEETKYHGPLISEEPWVGPTDWIKTEDGWEPMTTITTVRRVRATRESVARRRVEQALAPLPPVHRTRVLHRIQRMFGRDSEADR